MKAIELTEEHKSKLLEMCKVLFPEYDEFKFSNPEDPDAGFDSIDGILHLGISINQGKGFNVLISIHWFEFCLTHLATKLCKKDYNALSLNTYSNLIQYNQHPIDYLYEEFLKLK